jgi:hypothetical protein
MEADAKTERLNSKLTGKSKGEEAQSGHFKGKFKENTLKESSNLSLELKPNKEDSNLSGSLKKNESKDASSQKRNKKAKAINHETTKDQKTKESKDIDKNITKSKSSGLAPVSQLPISKSNEKSKKSGILSKDEGLVEKPKSEMHKAMINPAANAVRISSDSVFYLCDLVDMFEEELYVTIKDNNIDKELNYNIVLSIDMGSQKATITTEGKVDSVQNGVYKFNISKIPQSDYDRFMSHFEIKQDEINDFLIAARGF